MNQYEDVIAGAQRYLLHMPDPIYMIGTDDRIIWVNKAFEELFDYTAEFLHMNGLKFYPEYTSIEVEEYKRQLQRSDTVNVYTSRYCRDGTRLYVNMNLMPVRGEDGEIAAYTVVLKETVSEERLNDLRDKRYRIVAENTSDTIVLVDNDAIVRYVSPSIKGLSGYDTEEYEGLDAFEPVHPDDRDAVRLSHLAAVQTKQPVNVEYRIVHKRGDIVYVEARVMPVIDQDGNMEYVVAVARDITERKQTDQLLQSILDNVNAAVWSSDKEFSRLSFCSESIEKIFGLPKSVVETNPIRLHDNIHPDDADLLLHEVGRELKTGVPATQAVRLMDAAREEKWVKIVAQPIMNHVGEIERIDGIFLDITEQKRSELALEESEQRYKSLFENNLDGVFSIHLDGRLVNANKSFEAIAGMPLDRLLGSAFTSLVAEEDFARVSKIVSRVIEHRKPRDIECSMRRASNRDETIVSVTLVPIFLSGQLNGVHGIVKDITARKREERELIQSEEKSKFLQMSLNRLSSDLANVMKVAELEQRLIDEVEAVLQVSGAAVEEVPYAEMQASPHAAERWIKISEKKHPVYLRFRAERPLLKMEEEWLETAIRYVTLLYDHLELIQELMNRLETMVAGNETPKWMLRLLFKLSEKERVSLSSDLHDSVLQDLIIWYRKLESLRSQNRFAEGIHAELARIEEGLLDAIHQIRITCNELRPPFLLKMGLTESIKSLLSYTRMFSNYEIEFAAERFGADLGEEQIIGLYRIVQELLNNASKHSQASKVKLELAELPDRIQFSYSDDGVGMDLSSFENSFQHMGISGIEKRVLSLDGNMDIRSAPRSGFHVRISIPKIT